MRDPYDPRFDNAKQKEVVELLRRGTYQVTDITEPPAGSVVLNSRFVLSINEKEGEDPIYKARLVIMGHQDPEKGRIVNEAPTVTRSSVRLIIALSKILRFKLWTRDVTQTFLQSKDALKRDMYIRAPRGQNVMEMLGSNKPYFLKAEKPLYGLCESPGNWWATFRDHHIKTLGTKHSVMDPCLFWKCSEDSLQGLQIVLVDDTLSTGTDSFMNIEEDASKVFETKARTTDFLFTFNGITIESDSKSSEAMLRVHQSQNSLSLRALDQNFTPEQFSHLHGQLAYIASSTRPDVSFCVAKLSQCRPENATKSEARVMKKVLDTLRIPNTLVYRRINPESLVICVYADASFAGNVDHSSQIGMAIVLKDNDDNAALIHYGSWKCRRVTRSVLAAEVHAFTDCMDYVLALQHDLSSILDKKIPTVVYTYSKCLFDTITKVSSVSEKRLLINIASIREEYTSGS